MNEAGRRLIAALVAPIRRFFNVEAASAIVLLGAAVLALLWANSPLASSYRWLFERPFALHVAGHAVQVQARAVLTEGLMPFFFLLAGMEIKREIVEGELRSLHRALLPAVAALGGMVVPALVFRAVAGGGVGARGWGIPMATDIAFGLGVLKLLGRRVPRSLVVFMTALAIFDDLGGVLVIALFYGDGLHPGALIAAAGIAAVLMMAGRHRVKRASVYLTGGALLWAALHLAGVHPTIAGVIVGFAIPGRDPRRQEEGEPMLDRAIRLWHPWVAFGVVPLFALASSGTPLAGAGGVHFGRVSLATAAALLVGKQTGIFGATVAAVKLGLGALPRGASWSSLYGVSVVAGIGFTVALFIADLAYADSAALLDEARAGIVLGSLASAIGGVAVLRSRPRA